MEYYLCILDFEATCWENPNHYQKKEQMEIIEFPSILYKITETVNPLNVKIEYISEFAKYVKPVINPELSMFCTELTGITQETVNKAEPFKNVYYKHIQWLNIHIPFDSKLIFATCGKWDLQTQLIRELRNKCLKLNNLYNYFIDVKKEVETFYKIKVKSMPSILEYLHLPFIGRHHSGIDDTRNIANIMLKIIEDGNRLNNFDLHDYNNL